MTGKPLKKTFGEPLVAPLILPEIRESLQAMVEAERQVIVHCCFPATFIEGNLIRIWHSTFLIANDLPHKSTLLHHENISLFPFWTEVPAHRDYWFTLIFSGLPNDCKSFSLREEIPQDGGFVVKDISRNSSDIYRIKIT